MLVLLALCAHSACAQDEAEVRGIRAIETSLPKGWMVAQRRNGVAPWGHNWCDKVSDITGSELTIQGPQPSHMRLKGMDDQWKVFEDGHEALTVWIMPGSYREITYVLRCGHRPVQPTLVFGGKQIRVYARPSSYATPDERKFMMDFK